MTHRFLPDWLAAVVMEQNITEFMEENLNEFFVLLIAEPAPLGSTCSLKVNSRFP